MRISAAGVWMRRSGRARVALVAISATVLVLAASLTLTAATIDLSGRDGIRESLTGPAAALNLTAITAADSGAQNAAIRREIAIVFHDVPVSVTRTDVSPDSEGEPRTRWSIAPQPSRIAPSDLAGLQSGFMSIAHRIESTPSTQTSSVRSSGTGLAKVIAARRGLAAIGTITPVPLALLALSGLIALVLARGVLTDVRANETRLLRSRGGSVRSIVAIDFRESLLVCLTGSVVGAGVGWLIAVMVFPAPPSAIAVLVPALAVFAGALLLNATMSWLAARSASGAPRAGSGRRRAIASGAALAFGMALTGVAIWRFEVGIGAGANVAQDPLAVVAPAAIVLAAVLACLAFASWSALRAERRLFTRATANRLVPVRDVNRRVPLLAAPTALLAIAVAVSTLSASYAATWTRYENDSRLLAAGAPLRATLPVDGGISDSGDLAPIDRLQAVPGVVSAVPAGIEVDQYSDTDVTVVGVSAGALPRLIPADSTVIDPSALAKSLGTYTPRGLTIPAGAGSIELTVTASASRAAPQQRTTSEPDTVSISLWLSDRLGDLARVALSPVTVTLDADAPTATAATALPDGGPWAIVAMDVTLQTPQPASVFSFSVTGARAITAGDATPIGLPSTAWRALDSVFQDGATQPVAGHVLGFGRATVPQNKVGGLTVRMMPQRPSPVAVVVSRPFAQAHGLRAGDGIDLEGAWSSFHGTVRGVVDLVPGTTSGSSVIADLPALNEGRLRTSEDLEVIHQIWIGADPTRPLAARLAAAMPTARIAAASRSGSDFTAVAATALWIGAAGSVVFAWVALAAVASTLLRRRSDESRMLRALGVRAGTQGRWRRDELFGTATVGLITGVVAGVIASAVVVTPLARLATTGAPLFLPAQLQVDPLPIVVAALIAGAGATILIAVYGRLVERGSR